MLTTRLKNGKKLSITRQELPELLAMAREL